MKLLEAKNNVVITDILLNHGYDPVELMNIGLIIKNKLRIVEEINVPKSKVAYEFENSVFFIDKDLAKLIEVENE